MTAHLAAAPFPDLADHDLLLAYAALTGTLSALVPAAVYADAVVVARKAVAERRGVAVESDVVLVPLIGRAT